MLSHYKNLQSSRIFILFISFLLTVCIICHLTVVNTSVSSPPHSSHKTSFTSPHLQPHHVSWFLNGSPVFLRLFCSGILHTSGIPMEMWMQVYEEHSIINKRGTTETVSSHRHGLYASSSLCRIILFNIYFFQQDTVVALQALSLFAALTSAHKTDMDITVTATSLETPEIFSIDTQNRFLLQTKEVL